MIMSKQGKVWGNTQWLFSKNNVSIHRIFIKKGGYCSKHKHTSKYNTFIVESGQVEIRVWKDKLEDVILLEAGELTTVKPSDFHMFTAKADSIVYEVYHAELLEDDIEREKSGGVK